MKQLAPSRSLDDRCIESSAPNQNRTHYLQDHSRRDRLFRYLPYLLIGLSLAVDTNTVTATKTGKMSE
eukprot:scaffold2837_cov210-Skeletonema_menzelii.AAC.2